MIDIVKKLDQETAKRIHQSNRQSNWPSELGWWEECPRYLVLARTDSDKMPLHEISLQRIFDEGNKQEKLVRAELEAAGYDIIDVQRDAKWKHLNISGHIDGRIKLNGKKPLLEIKSCSPNVFQSILPITEAEELKGSKHFWIRRYYAQMQGYHLLFDEEDGMILFKDKSTGQKHIINSTLNYEYCEKMCKVIEEVNDRVGGSDPWPVEMKSACKHCPFAATVCFPDKDFGPGFEFLSDGEIEAKLARREELRSIAKEYDRIDKELKGHFKGRSAVIGDFIIESKEFERKNYKVPVEIKAQYLEIGKYWRTSIERLGANKETE